MTPTDSQVPVDSQVIDTKQALRGMFDDMRAIGTTSARIGEVVNAINETAFSTSLFALARKVEVHEPSTSWQAQSEEILEEERELVAVGARKF